MSLILRIITILLAALLAAGLVPLPEFTEDSFRPPADSGAQIQRPERPVPPLELPMPPDVRMARDVSPTDWFYPYVRIGYRHGFFRGADDRFEPLREITRAEFVTILGRMHTALGGLVDYDLGEFDLEDYYIDITSDYYTSYLAWATALEIVAPDDGNRFRPDVPIRREEIAAMLAHYIGAYDLHGHFEDVYEDRGLFADWEDVSPWAYHEVQLMRNYHIMLGTRPEGAPPGAYWFLPDTATPRGEAAAIFARLFLLIFDAAATV